MNLVLVAIGLLALAVIALGILSGFLIKRINALTQGQNAVSLESVIKNNNKELLKTQKILAEYKQRIQAIEEDSLRNIQNIGMVRFNPFKETGGSQSFAIALTDKKSNGVVISSLYARERINVFAKPLVGGASEYTLSKEELKAIEKSLIN